MSYEWTSCVCPVCGDPAEYNCVEDKVFCQACRNTKRRAKAAAVERKL